MMRVLVDAMSATTGGGQSYLLQQLTALEEVRPDLELTILTIPRNHAVFQRQLRSQVRRIPVGSLPSRLAYEQSVLPFTSRHYDLLYCPGNFCPLLRTSVPILLTAQNSRYFGAGRLLDAAPGMRLRAELWLSDRSVQRADGVVVISESLRQEMARDGLAGARCHVILSGRPSWPDAEFPPPGFPTDAPFFVVMANDYPHKRLRDVLDAWRDFWSLRGSEPVRLVIAGEVSAARRREHLSILGPASRAIVYLGRVSERSQIKWLLSHSRGLVSASELEAFPLTPVEASSVGCPLILSDIPAHREVAAPRARFFPLRTPRALAEHMLEELRAPSIRARWRWPVAWADNASRLAEVMEAV